MSSYRRALKRALADRPVEVQRPAPRPRPQVRTGESVEAYRGQTVDVVTDVDGIGAMVVGTVYVADDGRFKVGPGLRVTSDRRLVADR